MNVFVQKSYSKTCPQPGHTGREHRQENITDEILKKGFILP